MTDPMELVGRAEHFDGAHKRGCELRSWSCTCGDDETAMNLIAQMAACIREMVEVSDRMDQILAAYLAGEPNEDAAERVRAKYASVINPPAPGAEE